MFIRREQECCPFLGFTIREDSGALILVIEAPEIASEAADAFGTYTATRHSGEIDTAQDRREARDVLDLMTEGNGNILGIRATGKLSNEDYQHVLAPRVQWFIEQFHTLRVLFLMDETFQGWSLKAAWVNTIFDLKHRRAFEKIAMIGAPKWEEWCVKTAATLLMHGKMRTFRPDQLNQAWHWLRA